MSSITFHPPSLGLVVQLRTRSSESDVEKLSLASNNHTSLTSKLEVGSCGSGVDLADELAGGVPDVDTITATSIDATLGVSVDTCVC